MSDWQPMDSAPRDGSEIQVRIPGHGSDNVVAWQEIYEAGDGGTCGGWTFTREQEPPDDWSDGVCWLKNEEGVPSTQPAAWKLLAPDFQ